MNYLRDHKIPKKITPLAEHIYGIYQQYMLRVLPEGTLTNNKKQLMWKATKCFTLNAAYHCSKSRNRIPVVYRKEYYAEDLIYNGRKINRKVSRTYTLALFDALSNYGYATFIKGGVEEWDYDFMLGKVFPAMTSGSYCTLGEDLFDRVLAVNQDESVKIQTNVIQIKNNNKKTTAKRLGEAQKMLMNTLIVWNRKLYNSLIEVDGECYEVQGHKVFNNSSFEKGGRTYLTGVGDNMDMIQCARRSRLKIDGKPTVEIDYKTLNPSIIMELSEERDDYAEGFDAYAIDIDGYDREALRGLAKYAFMMLIGCKTKQGAVAALRKYIGEDKKNRDGKINEFQKQGKLPETIDSGLIVDLVYERNTYAAEWFHSESALDLQNIDSKMMDYCIDYFVQHDKFILPIHDSIVVVKEDLDDGMRIMREAYKYVLGSNVNCKLKVVDYCD